MPKLSIIILTFNEAHNIGACLDSLQNLDAPVFVVDSYSTDRTLEILTARNIQYQQHAFENYAQQRNWAQENLPYNSEWVLHLDAGERLTPELLAWLKTGFKPDNPVNGYLISRRTYFMNRWIRHGGHYPNYHLRLFRRHMGSCEPKAYDQHFVCAGPVQKVPAGADMLDHVAKNLLAFTASHARWAMIEAQERIATQSGTGAVKPRFWGTAIEQRRWLKSRVFDRSPMFARAFLYFMYRYFIRLGFLDGAPGLVFHFLQACWFRFLVDALILENKTQNPNTP